MAIGTPFHARTSALNMSLDWREWAGYHAVRSYDVSHEREYFAFRHAAGLTLKPPAANHRFDRRPVRLPAT